MNECVVQSRLDVCRSAADLNINDVIYFIDSVCKMGAAGGIPSSNCLYFKYYLNVGNRQECHPPPQFNSV